MDVQDSLVTSTEERLVLQQIQKVQLGIKVGDGRHWQVATAENKSGRNFILVNSS